jgi:hypothetical protein
VYGLSLGGPIVKDKLHFHGIWNDRYPIYNTHDDDDNRLGITVIDRFLQI